jgi:cytochrome c oxidase subunit 3
VLLSSGFTVSRGHEDTILGRSIDAIEMHEATLSLGAAFSLFQSEEYVASAFDFCDSVYAAAFFLTTGFHGSHVSIGSFLMLACYFISSFDLHEKTTKRHLGLEFSIAYWHFVDLIWLLVFSLMYVWGS